MASSYVTTGELLARQFPCWCGRPSVEVVSECLAFGEEAETRGYCHLHCQETTTTVTRHRQDAPRV